MSIPRLFQLLGAAVFIGGTSIFIPFYSTWSNQQQAVRNSSAAIIPAAIIEPTNGITYKKGHPVRVVIPSLNINLPVINGTYNATNGEWTLTDTKVQFATITSLPNNEKGNTLLYGHNSKQLLGELYTIQKDAIAYVDTSEGYRFYYRFTYAEKVKPTNTDVFLYTGTSRLTIQTCTGWFYENRLLHYFDFEKVESL